MPGATSYVTRVQRSENERDAQNVGALHVNEKLDGRRETVTPPKQFLLFITAEASPRAMTPTAKALMRTNVVMKYAFGGPRKAREKEDTCAPGGEGGHTRPVAKVAGAAAEKAGALAERAGAKGAEAGEKAAATK